MEFTLHREHVRPTGGGGVADTVDAVATMDWDLAFRSPGMFSERADVDVSFSLAVLMLHMFTPFYSNSQDVVAHPFARRARCLRSSRLRFFDFFLSLRARHSSSAASHRHARTHRSPQFLRATRTRAP